MFSSRRLQAMVLVLIVGVLSGGFTFTGGGPEAIASDSDECQTALQACYDAALYEALVCGIYGSNHKLCIQAKGIAASKCLQAVIICEN